VGRPCEFGPSRPRDAQLADIAAGRERLAQLLGPLVAPVFTPPWNRCTTATAECLVEFGFAALSRDSTAEPLGVPGLDELPVQVDWLARRKGVRVPREEVGRRAAAAADAGPPAGVMLHHAEMDADERRALAQLLELVAPHCAPMALCVAAG
jgi:hypothetical protein